MSIVGFYLENFQKLTSLRFRMFKCSPCTTTRKIKNVGKHKKITIPKEVEGSSRDSQRRKPCNVKLDLVGSQDSQAPEGFKMRKVELPSMRNLLCSVKQQDAILGRYPEQLATIFVFDIETTGFSRCQHRIVEFALQDLRGGCNSTFHTLVNPERYIPNTNVHGISNYIVEKPGIPRWKDLAPILLHYVKNRQKPDQPVLWIAHNARLFDVPFIIEEFSRCSVQVPSDWLFLDTLPLARELVKSDGSKLQSLSLESLRMHYDIQPAGTTHRAMSDVHTLSLVLQRMTYDLKMSISALLERSFRAPV